MATQSKFINTERLIKELARPYWERLLTEARNEGVNLEDPNQSDWDFPTFCEEIALEVRIADAKN